jgi:hypothetical protein
MNKPSRVAVVLLCLPLSMLAINELIQNMQPFRDPTGFVATYSTAGNIDKNNAFFQPLGTNGRTCATCHQFDQAMGLQATHVRKLWAETKGTDTLFESVDGANCPDAKPGDAADHSLMLQNGLIRVGIVLPENVEFDIKPVHDPYGCAIMTDSETGRRIVSIYRRPLPGAGLPFLSAVMWDGRETVAPLNNEKTFRENLMIDLKHQAMAAVMGHAQGSQPPTDQQLTEIANMEATFFTAQIVDDEAGLLGGGAKGGPLQLSGQEYYPGINDSLGSDPHGRNFNPNVFSLYSNWLLTKGDNKTADRRRSIAAGEKVFNVTPLKITGVRGLNDNKDLGFPSVINGTCTTCHDTPNVGNHSMPLPLDIGTSHDMISEPQVAMAAALRALDVPDMPIYLITNCSDPQNPARKLQFYTSDPGKGLISGKCSDVNRIKGPILRGLAARAPFFHNGAAADLTQLVNFYNLRFQMNLTDAQKKDLVAFLSAL